MKKGYQKEEVNNMKLDEFLENENCKFIKIGTCGTSFLYCGSLKNLDTKKVDRSYRKFLRKKRKEHLDNCMLSEQEGYCSLKRIKWLLSEYKEPVKLSGLEYRILKYCLSKNYNHISRIGIGNMLIVSEYKLKKNRYNFIESDGDWTSICLLDDSFQFIKLGDDSTSIKDVLNSFDSDWMLLERIRR